MSGGVRWKVDQTVGSFISAIQDQAPLVSLVLVLGGQEGVVVVEGAFVAFAASAFEEEVAW